VLDVRLLAGDGIEVCREIRSRHPAIACLMLTSLADDEALFSAIMAGAAGYVLKHVRGTDLVDGIRRVAAGETLLDPKVTTRVLERLRHPPEDDELAGLTEQERRLLDLIAEGLTNRQICERMYLAEKTVKNYVQRAGQAGHEPACRGRRLRCPSSRGGADGRVAPSKREPTSALWAPRRQRPAGHSLTRSQRASQASADSDASPPLWAIGTRKSTARRTGPSTLTACGTPGGSGWQSPATS